MKLHRFEHLNLTCRSLDTTQQFYQTLFPDWRVRAQGVGPTGDRWVHFGNDQVYLSLNHDPASQRTQQPYEGTGINHVGFVIEDGEAFKALLAANHIEFYTLTAPETRHRIYVSDPDGNEVELVEYHSSYALR